jgi:ubiquitin-conjugating enzyme E2 variant
MTSERFPEKPPLPMHLPIGFARQVLEATCIGTALFLLSAIGIRLWNAEGHVGWMLPLVLIVGAISADFVSGVVHWTADTWGTETMPLLGRRFVHPFRVHHVNPEDFLRRRFLDTNGDVSMLGIPFLAAAHALPLATNWGQLAAAFMMTFCAVALPTNQVHQWAHMPRPPRVVRWLQDRRVILSRREHSRHHCEPYARNYCIATGWCNPLLERIQFFRRLERIVTRTLGLRPRADDAAFQQTVEGDWVRHATAQEVAGG